jgi:hypothetical protein
MGHQTRGRITRGNHKCQLGDPWIDLVKTTVTKNAVVPHTLTAGVLDRIRPSLTSHTGRPKARWLGGRGLGPNQLVRIRLVALKQVFDLTVQRASERQCGGYRRDKPPRLDRAQAGARESSSLGQFSLRPTTSNSGIPDVIDGSKN